MKNFLQKGDAIDVVTPSGGMTAGVFYMIGALCGVAALTTLVGEGNVLHRTGVYSLKKAASETWAIGNELYFDESESAFTKTAAGNIPAGTAAAIAASDAVVGAVLLTPAGSGLTIKAGQHTTVSAADTVVTGLSSVLSVVSSFETDPADANSYVNAQIGDQAGTPAAGSIIIKTWKQSGTDPTPVAADAFSKKVNWIAVGTAN